MYFNWSDFAIANLLLQILDIECIKSKENNKQYNDFVMKNG